MVPVILPDTDIPIKTLTTDQLGEVSSNVESEPIDSAGAIVIRIGLCGICSVQIIADESTEEEALRERLTTARPALELLHRTVQALHAEPIGVGG